MIDKIKIFKQYGGDEKNSGSTESQIALFTERIKDITNHLKSNKKDKNTQRSLQLLVGKRRKTAAKIPAAPAEIAIITINFELLIK